MLLSLGHLSEMGPLDIIKLINTLFTLMVSVFLAYKTLFVFIGFGKPINFPETFIKRRYAIMISARNEERVIGNLIRSIRKQNYPAELITIFVVADNCQDGTASLARSLGAVVYERHSKKEIGKGYALSFLVDNIKQDFGIKTFAGYFVFDADNLLDPDYVARMNDAFASGKDIITSYRNTKNFDTNFISASYAFHQYRNIRFNHIPRSRLNLSCNVTGTGFLMRNTLLENGWRWKLITEDIEFTIDSILEGYQVTYCHKAIFYDEQPVDMKTMFRQRIRWSKGFLLVFVSRGRKLLQALFRPFTYNRNNHSGQTAFQHSMTRYDLLMYITPFSLILFFWMIIYNIVFISVGLSMGSLPPDFWQGLLHANIMSVIRLYLVTLIQVLPVVILEWKSMMAPWYKKIIYLFTFPLFDFLNLPITLIALVTPAQWKPIPHRDTSTIEGVNAFFRTDAQRREDRRRQRLGLEIGGDDDK